MSALHLSTLGAALFLFFPGLITGVVAVICNWIVEARIDRAVLRP